MSSTRSGGGQHGGGLLISGGLRILQSDERRTSHDISSVGPVSPILLRLQAGDRCHRRIPERSRSNPLAASNSEASNVWSYAPERCASPLKSVFLPVVSEGRHNG